MPEETLQEILEDIKRLAEAEVVDCPEIHDTVRSTRCKTCNRWHADPSGQIPNPAYAPLLEVVRERRSPLHDSRLHKFLWPDCPGYVTRSWEGTDKGAVAWALEYASERIGGRFWDRTCDYFLRKPEDDDPDRAAAQAVRAALKGG